MNRKDKNDEEYEKSEQEILWDRKIKQIKKYVSGRPYKPDSMIIDQIARGTKDHEKMLLCLCHIGEISDCPIDFEEVHNRYKRKYGKNPLEIAEKTQKHTGFSFLKSASRASTVFEYAYNVFSQDHPLVEGVYQEQRKQSNIIPNEPLTVPNHISGSKPAFFNENKPSTTTHISQKDDKKLIPNLIFNIKSVNSPITTETHRKSISRTKDLPRSPVTAWEEKSNISPNSTNISVKPPSKPIRKSITGKRNSISRRRSSVHRKSIVKNKDTTDEEEGKEKENDEDKADTTFTPVEIQNEIIDHKEVVENYPSELAYVYRPFQFDSTSDEHKGKFKIRDPNDFIFETLYRKRDVYSATSGVSLLCGKLTHNPNQEATLSILFSKEKFTEITAYEWWEKNKERFINELHHTVIPTSELIKRDSVIKYIEESKDPSKPILIINWFHFDEDTDGTRYKLTVRNYDDFILDSLVRKAEKTRKGISYLVGNLKENSEEDVCVIYFQKAYFTRRNAAEWYVDNAKRFPKSPLVMPETLYYTK